VDLDLDRWAGLLAAFKNARDATPPSIWQQDAGDRWGRAQADLERYRARGPAAQTTAHSEAFDAGCRELEQRVAAAEAEMKRIGTHIAACAAKRTALHALADGVRRWAQAQTPPIALPGDESSSTLPGFGTAVRIHSPHGSNGRVSP